MRPTSWTAEIKINCKLIIIYLNLANYFLFSKLFINPLAQTA